ncbi:uncharacterized protein LOC120359795 isoform X1 [Solenopsis invicta]|uniref:uncharacterized protein LOC120359795 isoform X1 n=1 Tax=Solenopsis invicta TaxID=13686 RepID=UPI00193D1934|nr:uncharacterized protein LOC120359795 isoform X1 [Solenopsis invicta]
MNIAHRKTIKAYFRTVIPHSTRLTIVGKNARGRAFIDDPCLYCHCLRSCDSRQRRTIIWQHIEGTLQAVQLMLQEWQQHRQQPQQQIDRLQQAINLLLQRTAAGATAAKANAAGAIRAAAAAAIAASAGKATKSSSGAAAE